MNFPPFKNEPYTYLILKNASKRFYYSALSFPKEVRDDVVTLYAFCRIVDDIADDLEFKGDRLKRFKEFKDDFYKAIKDRTVNEHILNEFGELVRRKNINIEYVEALFFSIECDIKGFEYKTMEELERYVYGVGGAVGIMMCQVLKLDPKSYECANLFGYSFQWSNMIRDIYEDYQMNRTYFPKEHLEKFGLKDLSFETLESNPAAIENLIEYEIEIYEKYYKKGVEGLKYIPKRYLAAIKTAADIDLWTIEQIRKNPLVIYERKVKPSNFTILQKGIGNLIAVQF